MNRELSLCLIMSLCAMGCVGQSGPAAEPLVRRVPPSDSAPMRAVGPCYAVQTGEWTPRVDIGGDTIFLTLPSRSVVDTLPVTRSWYPGKPLYGLGLPRPFDRGYWKQERPDSAEIVFTNEYSGVVLSVQQYDAGWRGIAETYWDFPRPTQRASVEVNPITCGVS